MSRLRRGWELPASDMRAMVHWISQQEGGRKREKEILYYFMYCIFREWNREVCVCVRVSYHQLFIQIGRASGRERV